MKLFGKIIFSIISNLIALLAADYILADLVFTGTFVELLIAAAIFTAINMFLKPILKLLFGPLIILTLGLFVVVINALTLYLLDMLSTSLTIQGYLPLLVATVIVGAVNTVIHLSAKLAKH